MRIQQLILGAAFGAAAVLGASQASASNLKATYYTIPETGDADFGASVPCCSFTFTDNAAGEVVGGALGVDGLPVYNTAFTGPQLFDVNSNGELTWWSSKPVGSALVNLPIDNTALFPAPGTFGDANAFLTATYRGDILVAPGGQTITFNLSSDDDSFLAIDGSILAQDGGVHALGGGVSVTETLSAGIHPLEIFYADRHDVAAALEFSAPGADIVGVPEPATWAMMLVGFGGLGAAMRSRRKQAAAAA